MDALKSRWRVCKIIWHTLKFFAKFYPYFLLCLHLKEIKFFYEFYSFRNEVAGHSYTFWYQQVFHKSGCIEGSINRKIHFRHSYKFRVWLTLNFSSKLSTSSVDNAEFYMFKKHFKMLIQLFRNLNKSSA